MTRPDRTGRAKDRVMLMATCLCDAFFGDAAKATVEVLESVGCQVVFPEGQTCCGQPALNAGDFAAFRKVFRHTLEVFHGHEPVIIPSGSCTALCRHHAALAFEAADDLPAVRDFGKRCWELTDFIVNGLGVTRWPGRLDARIAFHHSCHTRGTGSRAAATTLLRSITGCQLAEFDQTQQCCGFGGVFSVSFPYVSAALGRSKLERVRKADPQLLVSLDTGCLMHLLGLARRSGSPIPTRHVAEVLADALDQDPEPATERRDGP